MGVGSYLFFFSRKAQISQKRVGLKASKLKQKFD